jgi:hypothetical protein
MVQGVVKPVLDDCMVWRVRYADILRGPVCGRSGAPIRNTIRVIETLACLLLEYSRVDGLTKTKRWRLHFVDVVGPKYMKPERKRREPLPKPLPFRDAEWLLIRLCSKAHLETVHHRTTCGRTCYERTTKRDRLRTCCTPNRSAKGP